MDFHGYTFPFILPPQGYVTCHTVRELGLRVPDTLPALRDSCWYGSPSRCHRAKTSPRLPRHEWFFTAKAPRGESPSHPKSCITRDWLRSHWLDRGEEFLFFQPWNVFPHVSQDVSKKTGQLWSFHRNLVRRPTMILFSSTCGCVHA